MRLILSAITILALTGCAAVNSVHTPPAPVKIQTTKVVPSEFEPVWSGLVKELSGSFFVVNNIDKNSRFLNISFSTNQPSKYVNCGKIVITAEGPNSKRITWDPTRTTVIREIGRASEYNIPVPLDIGTLPKLEGRINMYIAPGDAGGTEAKVAVRYIFSVNKRPVQPIPRNVAWQNDPISESFTTNGASDDMQCIATGELERELLSFVK